MLFCNREISLEILSYGIIITPGLVVEGNVKSVGKMPGNVQMQNWLK